MVLLVAAVAWVASTAVRGEAGGGGPGQEPGAAAPPGVAPQDTGTLVPRRVVAGDTTKSYAVFLPPGYDTAHRWPALVLMDPRGRALLPLERFRPAAAALGYVVLSSYDTSSDEPTSGEDTRAAVESLLNDAVTTLSLDARRFYLVGFSGTARAAWGMALASRDHFPAIVGFGGGMTPTVHLSIVVGGVEGPGFFGGAGTGDFNYAEMWSTDEGLDRLGLPHALMYFPGPHGWPPTHVATAAVEWLELRAQATGLAPQDSGWIRDRFAAGAEAARALEAGDRVHDAMLAFRRVAATFDGFGPPWTDSVAALRADHDRLAATSEGRETDRRLRRWLEWENDRREAFDRAWIVLEGRRVPDADRLASIIELRALRRQALDDDTLAAQAATRMLAVSMAMANFYLPRSYLAAGDTLRAVRALELAHRIDPGSAAVCFRFRPLAPDDRARSTELDAFCASDDSVPGRDRPGGGAGGIEERGTGRHEGIAAGPPGVHAARDGGPGREVVIAPGNGDP
jgi:predicted esterase